MKIKLKVNVYNNNKEFIKEVFKKFNLKWVYVKSGWFKSPNSVIKTTDQQFVILEVKGDNKFIQVMEKIANSLKAEIVDENPKGISEKEIKRRIEIERKYWIGIGTSKSDMKVQLDAFERVLRKVKG